MEFISIYDINDNILTCRESDIDYANDYLRRLAISFGLSEEELQTPARASIKQLGKAVACRECAAAMIGSDTTVMVDGNRTEDVYYRKYQMYVQLAKDLETRITYADFAVTGTDASGKGGVGVIKLSRG